MSLAVATDTQVIILADQSRDTSGIQSCHASSVTLAEYLMMQSDDYSSPAYYLPGYGRPKDRQLFDSSRFQRHVSRRWARMHTDSIPVVLRGFHPVVTTVYWGMPALAEIINGRDRDKFRASLDHITRRRRSRILRKFDFIVKADMRCDALTKQDTEFALGLMDRFMQCSSPKGDV